MSSHLLPMFLVHLKGVSNSKILSNFLVKIPLSFNISNWAVDGCYNYVCTAFGIIYRKLNLEEDQDLCSFGISCNNILKISRNQTFYLIVAKLLLLKGNLIEYVNEARLVHWLAQLCISMVADLSAVNTIKNISTYKSII